MGLAIFVAIGLWRTGLLQENKISFEMYFTFIFPLVIGLITMISFLSNFIANRRKNQSDPGLDPSEIRPVIFLIR